MLARGFLNCMHTSLAAGLRPCRILWGKDPGRGWVATAFKQLEVYLALLIDHMGI